jgi:hypothetical protein
MLSDGVLEPLAVKEQIPRAAIEGTSMILRIDDVIAVGKARAGGPRVAVTNEIRLSKVQIGAYSNCNFLEALENVDSNCGSNSCFGCMI